MSEKADLPPIFSPEEIAHHFGWSPRKLRQKAREIGACRIMGNRMVLTEEDLAKLLEATKPTPVLPPRPKGDYAELLKLRKKQTPERR